MILIKTNENNDDHGCQYQIVICLCDLRSSLAFVCDLFPITRINQDFLLAIKCEMLKSSLDSRYCVRPS